MRIALCFFGQARLIETSVYNILIQSLEDGDSMDVYIHCWWDGGFYGNTDSGRKNINVDSDTIDKIKVTYNPVKMFTEPQKQFEEYKDIKSIGDIGGPVLNRLSQMYSMEKVYSLIDTPTDYDWIIITRFDLKWRSYVTKVDFKSMIRDRTYSAYLHFNSLPSSLLEFCPGKISSEYYGKIFVDIREIGLWTAERYLRAVLDRCKLACNFVPLYTSFDTEKSIQLFHSVYISSRSENGHHGLLPPYDVY